MDGQYINTLIDFALGRGYENYDEHERTAQKAFLETEMELKRLNGSIRSKKVTDNHLGNSIFNSLRGEISNAQIKTYGYDHFTAAYNSFCYLRDKMIAENCFDEVGIRKYGILIFNLIFDVTPFANYIGRLNDSSYNFQTSFKFYTRDSIAHFTGSVILFYNSTNEYRLNNDIALILSAVSLRQTIELKMQRILGIADISDKNGKKIFTQHNFFFDFIIKNKKHFSFGTDIKIIQKIFEFCNLSVHRGVMPYHWQMDYALRLCYPLFKTEPYDESAKWSLYSAIKIEHYKELQQKIQKDLIKLFPQPNYALQIHWNHPEAQII